MVIVVTGIIVFVSGERVFSTGDGRSMRYREYIIRDVEDTCYFFYAINDDIERYKLSECMNTTVVLWLYSRFKSGAWKTGMRIIGIADHGLRESLTSTAEQRGVVVTDKVKAPAMARVNHI